MHLCTLNHFIIYTVMSTLAVHSSGQGQIMPVQPTDLTSGPDAYIPDTPTLAPCHLLLRKEAMNM